MRRCKFVCVEGADKSGKATQTRELYESLVANNRSVALIEVPTKGLTHKVIYWMLRNSWARRFPNAFQFVQFLNKLSFQLLSLPSYVDRCDFVVFDRWSLSAIVYGDATGVNKRFNRFLFSLLMKPDVTLVMHGRSFSRSGKDDTYEADNELQKSVKRGYFEWATSHPHDHEPIDNTGSVDEVHARVVLALRHRELLP